MFRCLSLPISHVTINFQERLQRNHFSVGLFLDHSSDLDTITPSFGSFQTRCEFTSPNICQPITLNYFNIPLFFSPQDISICISVDVMAASMCAQVANEAVTR